MILYVSSSFCKLKVILAGGGVGVKWVLAPPLSPQQKSCILAIIIAVTKLFHSSWDIILLLLRHHHKLQVH